LKGLLLSVLAVAACGQGKGSSPSASGSASGPDAGPVFSREAFVVARDDAGSDDAPVPTEPDPRALEEILAAAKSARPSEAPAPDGRDDLLGADTGVLADAGARGAGRLESGRGGHVTVGPVKLESGVSNPAIERAARAELYWPLVQRCRDAQGLLLPPEVVRLDFQLDRDGYVMTATIHAVAKQPEYLDAARCMARELAIATFRAPAGARGTPQKITMDVPSVD
jgi:hypothetical protein